MPMSKKQKAIARMATRVATCLLILFAVALTAYRLLIRITRPNVILIIVDTLRPDHLGCYGYSKNTSPNIDKFARESILYENCFSHAPATLSSVASIMTGFLPHETKVFDYTTPLFSAEINTLAERLKSQGYATVAMIGNFVLRKGRGFEQGFDVYNDGMFDRELVRRIPEAVAENITSKAIAYLKNRPDSKFFLYLHYQDPHGPYTPPPPYNTMFYDKNESSRAIPVNDVIIEENKIINYNRAVSGDGGIPFYQKLGNNRDYAYYVAQYDGEIRYFDAHFKTLMDTLKGLKLYNNSLIILTADHGEGMGEHDYYFAHGEHLYNSLIHVPLIIRYGKQARRIRSLVQHIDLMPTILDIAHIKKGLDLRGRELMKRSGIEAEVLSELHDEYTFIDRGIKLCYNIPKKEYRLFNILEDPNEENNIFGTAPYKELERELREKGSELLKKDSLNIEMQAVLPTEEEKQKLRSLGYL
jgi:arylsulfatase A-like enzyme